MFKEATYIVSAVSPKQYPNHQNLNEYVFLGRSNVGKSSFMPNQVRLLPSIFT